MFFRERSRGQVVISEIRPSWRLSCAEPISRRSTGGGRFDNTHGSQRFPVNSVPELAACIDSSTATSVIGHCQWVKYWQQFWLSETKDHSLSAKVEQNGRGTTQCTVVISWLDFGPLLEQCEAAK
jgi:hypothetical protein